MNKYAHRARVANFFGALGYFSILMQWMWAIIIIAYPMLTNPNIFQNHSTAPIARPMVALSLPPIVSLIIICVITLAMLVLTFAIVVTMPKTLSSNVAHVAQITTDAITPLVANTPKQSKKRKAFSARVMIGVKASLWIAPLLAVYFAPHNAPIPYDAVSATALFCAAATGVYFALQYAIAVIFKLPLLRLK